MREKALYTNNRTQGGIFEFPFGNIAQEVGPSPGGAYYKALESQQEYLQRLASGRG